MSDSYKIGWPQKQGELITALAQAQAEELEFTDEKRPNYVGAWGHVGFQRFAMLQRDLQHLATNNFIGHIDYRFHVNAREELIIIGRASTFAQNTWGWPEQVMRVTLQKVSPSVAVSKHLTLAEAIRGKGYSVTFFNYYSGVARLFGITTLMAFVKASNGVQMNRMRTLGWDDLGEFGVERVEDGEWCVRPHMFKKELF